MNWRINVKQLSSGKWEWSIEDLDGCDTIYPKPNDHWTWASWLVTGEAKTAEKAILKAASIAAANNEIQIIKRLRESYSAKSPSASTFA